MKSGNLVITIAAILLFGSCSKDDNDNESFQLYSASGNLDNTLAEFRQLLGTQLNTTPGNTSGRREINWDGIPDQLLNAKLPENFFNPVGPGAPVQNQRGLVYSSVGEFRVSKTGFEDVNSSAAGGFAAFSGNKTFANISSKLWDVEFQVPGELQAARVKGFGIVFSDVDKQTSTSMEFFDGNTSLGKFFVKPHAQGENFSFLGIYFPTPRISRVRVSHDGKLNDGNFDVTLGGPADLSVMDDFIYSEPVKN